MGHGLPPQAHEWTGIPMRRLLLIMIALSLAVVGLAGCSAAEPETRSELDDAIHEIEDHFGAFYLLGANAALADVQSLMGDIDASWTKLTDAAATETDHDITGATAAYEALKTAAADLTEEAPMPAIEPFVSDFRVEIEVLHEAGDFH